MKKMTKDEREAVTLVVDFASADLQAMTDEDRMGPTAFMLAWGMGLVLDLLDADAAIPDDQ